MVVLFLGNDHAGTEHGNAELSETSTATTTTTYSISLECSIGYEL